MATYSYSDESPAAEKQEIYWEGYICEEFPDPVQGDESKISPYLTKQVHG